MGGEGASEAAIGCTRDVETDHLQSSSHYMPEVEDVRLMSQDGARDGAEMSGPWRGGVWANVRGVDADETRGMAMCALRGPGCMWRMHKGRGQRWGPWSAVRGQRWQHCWWTG